MTRVNDLDLTRQLLDAPGPRADVIAAGQARLDALITAGPAARRPRARRPLAVACAAVTAAAAVTATALIALPAGTGGHLAPGHVNRPRGGAPSAAAVQAEVLASVTAAAGDVIYIRRAASTEPGTGTQEWFWPSNPAPFQQVHVLIRTADGMEIADTFHATARDQYTAGSAGPAIIGTQLAIDPHARTWSSQHGQTIRPQLPQATSAAMLRQDITAGVWTVIGRSWLAGQPAIELRTVPGANGLRELLWVNARTHLPMRQVKQNWDGPGTTLRYDIQYLRPTKARLARLTPAIPPGYHQDSRISRSR